MTRKDTFSLLVPRYLRGELTVAEKAEFQSYLEEHPDFQSDIDFQRNLMSARGNDSEMGGAEFGWARLSRSIDSLVSDNQSEHNKIAAPEKTPRMSGLWRIAAVTLACLSIGQILYITNSGTTDSYQLASENVTSGTTLQVGFAPDIHFHTISKFLLEHEAQITSGPSKLGIYTVSFSSEKNCDTAVETLISKEKFVETYTSCNTNS